jgi:3-oxoacyl-[acyl-carrier-protein] synthase II
LNPSQAVITGLGAISPVGLGAGAYVRGLREGKPGVRLLDPVPRPITPDAPALATRVVASPWGFDALDVLPSADVKRLPRLVPMALAAAREALTRAGLVDLDEDSSRRVGLILGTGGGGIDFTLDQASNVHTGRPPSLWTITNATHGNLAGELSIRLGLRGASLCVSDGCASSSDAVGMALSQLRGTGAGSPDAWVVIGADAHARWETMRGMELLRVINTEAIETDAQAGRASRPFDKTRAGFVLGEGAWACVVEREGFAAEREAQRLGEVLGYAATCDAYHRVRPDPGMSECVRAMRLAVEDAGLGMGDVGLVQYHGTGTELNDRQETAAVRKAFGEHAERLIGSSIKGAIGHPQGACGLASLVGMVGAMRPESVGLAGVKAFCPPTLNLDEADIACDLDYCSGGARELAAQEGGHVALINCLAFGAKNSALVVRA